jgi:glycolate oxidase FAD binding subunit
VTPWVDIVGAEHVGPGVPLDGVMPAWVVRPGSVAEVQECVRAAARTSGSLVVQGLGTHLTVGAPPARLDVVLRLDRLARVIDHQAGDMTVTAQAGCTLAALAATLERSGQWLPLDPPRADATTIGGLIAANLSGPLRASQGRVRDLLLGIRVVGADGALVAGGGRVVKNVAGYDLPKLHVGALGTLGVIVEATFKVRPRPACEEAVVIAARSVEAAADTALGVMAGEVAPFWLEVGGPGALPEGPGDGAAVVVGLAGIAEEVAHARARTLDLARARGLRAITVADGAALRARLADFALEPAAAVLRASMLPTEVGAFLVRAGRSGRCLAHAASGVVRVAVPEVCAVAALVAALRPGLEARGGSLVVERAPPEVKAQVDVWGDPGQGVALMRGVKAAFDPRGLFAPGRFVAGI